MRCGRRREYFRLDAVGEDEVRRRDGYAVAPVRFGADLVDEHEGALRDDGGAGDEVRSEASRRA